jgi:hypothetical protein
LPCFRYAGAKLTRVEYIISDVPMPMPILLYLSVASVLRCLHLGLRT